MNNVFQMTGSRALQWLVACLWLGLFSACSSSEELSSRSEEECRERACACVFNNECPASMLCYNGACEPREDATQGDTSGSDGDSNDGSGGDSSDTPDGSDGSDTQTKGGLGEFCAGNHECESGFCLDTATGGYCSQTCGQGCPQGWGCRTVSVEGDPITVCARDESRLCLPCEADSVCGSNNRCVQIGGGQFCGRDCSTSSCPTGYKCSTVPLVSGGAGQQCIPDNGTCDCTEATAGMQKACTEENEAGRCFGVATCDPANGFVGCSALTPSAETCDGIDNDCNGQTDEGIGSQDCTITNEFGACSGTSSCQGALGEVCSALTPAAEICNNADDDCDGSIDEDFRQGNEFPVTAEHCGECGFNCRDRFANSAQVACELNDGEPTCVLLGCEPGYVLLGGSCIDENATLCTTCTTDADCFGTDSRCLSLSDTDPRRFCARDCGGDNETSDSCPANFSCVDVGAGSFQCLPDSNSCDCTSLNDGGTKACSRTNAIGTCYGLEVCEAATGWGNCSALEPSSEVCDGIDNNCNGRVDEDIVTGEACQESNEFGTCSGSTICAGSAGIQCSANVPAAETCNNRDDDCDGTIDEGFAAMVGGSLSYHLDVNHCGACNYACPEVNHGTVACEISNGSPRCVAAACEEGYYIGPGGTACIPLPTANQCAQCQVDSDCQGPNDRCIVDAVVGSGYCARDCAFGSIYSSQANACTGAPGEQGCCEEGNVCTAFGNERFCQPSSGSCACTEDGAQITCDNSNSFGTCFGTRTCDLDSGLSACSAQVPAAEMCNGIDEDCDGRIDEADALDMSTTPNGQPSCGTAPGCSATWECLAGEWRCSAREPSGEVCDTIDNDCDGQVDEDFKNSQGLYVSNQHCGSCGLDCASLVVNAVTTECSLIGGTPTCIATQCAAGTYPFNGGVACLALPENLCESCQSDADCLVPSSKCLGTGADRYCARSCDANSPYGTDCPMGYVCTGGAQAMCVPSSGSCQCNPEYLGVTRACSRDNCVGLQICEEGTTSYGFTECSAEGLILEVCDGVDNDCDGNVDEGFVDAQGRYTTLEACGECGNNCSLRWTIEEHHAIGACSGGANAQCVIGQCTTETIGGINYEYVDTNGLAPDGCECRRRVGVTNDEPDLDFGTTRPSGSETYVDEDCDGVDGVITKALFVRAGAASGGNGTISAPYATISQAVSAFAASGKSYILVAGGEYRENVVLTNGVKLHGGYAPDFKRRSITAFETRVLGVEPAFLSGTPVPGAVHASNITQSTVLSGFTVRGYDVNTSPAVSQNGFTSYAVYILNSGSNLVLRNNRIIGGIGGRGADGSGGQNGYGRANSSDLNGGNGRNVESGENNCTSQDSSTVCGAAGNTSSRAGGSAGVNSQCETGNGIAGGAATCPVYNQASWTPPIAGKDGAPGYHWTRDIASWSSHPNACGGHLTEAGFPTAMKKMDGFDGTHGADGAGGLQGLGCSNGEGGLINGEWGTSRGADGVTGAVGARGGAGAPSGGVATATANQMSGTDVSPATGRWYKLGASGGGAGAGACGGAGGAGAGSGGASVGVFIAWTTTGTSAPTLVANVFERGTGGSGGTGGYGGSGGLGGLGGIGGNSLDFWVGFRAGNGGRGGNGGTGGGGGGGCGGASLDIGVFGKPDSLTVNYSGSNSFALPESVNTGGAGGTGGASGTPRSGANGANGIVKNQLVR